MKRTVTKSSGKRAVRLRVPIKPAVRRRMEAELRRVEEHIALSTLDALSTHIAILDTRGTILATNKAWRDFAREKHSGTERGKVGSHFAQSESSRGNHRVFGKFADGVSAV